MQDHWVPHSARAVVSSEHSCTKVMFAICTSVFIVSVWRWKHNPSYAMPRSLSMKRGAGRLTLLQTSCSRLYSARCSCANQFRTDLASEKSQSHWSTASSGASIMDTVRGNARTAALSPKTRRASRAASEKNKRDIATLHKIEVGRKQRSWITKVPYMGRLHSCSTLSGQFTTPPVVQSTVRRGLPSEQPINQAPWHDKRRDAKYRIERCTMNDLIDLKTPDRTEQIWQKVWGSAHDEQRRGSLDRYRSFSIEQTHHRQ